MFTLLLTACAGLPNWLNHISFAGINISIANILDTYGYFMVAVFIGIESTGIPFPGETMLVSASVYAAQGCGMQEPWVIVACIIGATTGDNIGFWVGRTGGRALIRKLPFVRESHLEPAEVYFRKYGAATVFFGRFLAVLRAWAAFLAGVNRMPPLTFFLCNFFGAVIWSTTFGVLGFELGKNLNRLQQVLTQLGTLGTVIIIAIIAAIVIWVIRRRRAAAEHAEPEAAPAPLPLNTAVTPVEPNAPSRPDEEVPSSEAI